MHMPMPKCATGSSLLSNKILSGKLPCAFQINKEDKLEFTSDNVMFAESLESDSELCVLALASVVCC